MSHSQVTLVERLLGRVSLCFAILGGFILVAVTILTVLSIIGRALIPLGLGPIPGDFELLEAGTVFSIFCFLPWCHMERGHVTVDVLKSFLGPRLDYIIETINNILMLVIAVVIAWRLWYGMLDKLKYHETTYILELPVWWGYLICILPACLFALISVFSVFRSATLARSPNQEADKFGSYE